MVRSLRRIISTRPHKNSTKFKNIKYPSPYDEPDHYGIMKNKTGPELSHRGFITATFTGL